MKPTRTQPADTSEHLMPVAAFWAVWSWLMAQQRALRDTQSRVDEFHDKL